MWPPEVRKDWAEMHLDAFLQSVVNKQPTNLRKIVSKLIKKACSRRKDGNVFRDVSRLCNPSVWVGITLNSSRKKWFIQTALDWTLWSKICTMIRCSRTLDSSSSSDRLSNAKGTLANTPCGMKKKEKWNCGEICITFCEAHSKFSGGCQTCRLFFNWWKY